MTRSQDSTQALSQDVGETLLHSLNKQSTSSTSTMPANFPQQILVGADSEIQTKRKISTDGELAKYQWWLQKTMEEKRQLQAELEAVRIQLMAVSVN